MNRQPRDRVVVAVWVLAHALAVLAAAGWWLARNELPDGFQNEQIHLFTLTEIWFRWREQGWRGAAPFLLDEYWPPALHVLPALAMAALGRSREVATFAAALPILPLLAGVASLAWRAGGRDAALLASTIVAASPAIFGSARRYEPNLLLATAVLAAVWLLAARSRWPGPGFALGLGAVLGLGMLADRLAFALYVGPALVVWAWRDRDWRRLALASALGAAICGPYYAHFIAHHLGEITSQLTGEVTSAGETPGIAPWSVRGVLYYPLSWIDGDLGLPLALVVFAGLAAWMRARRQVEARLIFESVLLGAGLVLLLIGKKQPYYAVPLIPIAAVLGSVGLMALAPGRGLRAAILGAVALVGLHQGLALTRGDGLVPAPGRWRALAGGSPFPPGFLGHEYVMAAPPSPGGLLPRGIAEACAATGGRTVLFSEAQGAFEGQVLPVLRLALDRGDVPGLLLEPEAFFEALDDARCFVYIAPRTELESAAAAEWPTAESAGAVMAQWGYEPPSAPLLSALDAARRRAVPIGGWSTERQETVRVYALGASRAEDLP